VIADQGWYCLYANLPGRRTLALNHREAGANYANTLGARDLPLITSPKVSPDLRAWVSEASGGRFALPPLRTVPTFDFHLHRVHGDVLLTQRAVFFSNSQMQRGCERPDYTPFVPDLLH
jgi:hypothetical protein